MIDDQKIFVEFVYVVLEWIIGIKLKMFGYWGRLVSLRGCILVIILYLVYILFVVSKYYQFFYCVICCILGVD